MDLSNRVVNAIIQLSHTVKEGDVVDIFFQCHGLRDGQLRLGDNLLSSETIAHLLTIFSEKVQVNCVGSHCYSGQLVDAIKATGTPLRQQQMQKFSVCAAIRSITGQVQTTLSRSDRGWASNIGKP